MSTAYLNDRSQGLKSGLHDISSDAYHSDPAPDPSLSSSGIRTLLNETPAHFKARHPRLTTFPDAIERPSTREQDLGTVVHRILLGAGCEFAVISGFDDFRKKEAQTLRDAAREEGRVPILEKTYAQAEQIAAHAEKALKERFGGWPIGDSEVTMLWQRETANGPIWNRALMDQFSHRLATVVDLKTTGRCISDDELARKLAGDGADIQNAHYVNGVETLFPDLAGLVQFIFVVVETEAPFAVRFASLSESWLTRARFRIDRAADTFANCLRTNNWPAWPMNATLHAPGYLEARWEAEEISA